MNFKENQNEIFTIILAAIILAVSVSIKDTKIFYAALLSFLIIITVNVVIKKIIAYHFEIDIKTKFWAWHKYGLRKNQHFKKPLTMAWLPLVASFLTKGNLLWMGILEYDATPRAERASRRHGLYRFTEVTERHIGWIALWAVVTNLILGIIGYVAGFELFSKLNFFFAMWSVIPISRLDGTKILFANKTIWAIIATITSILFFLSFGI
jgi:hypothetical protein